MALSNRSGKSHQQSLSEQSRNQIKYLKQQAFLEFEEALEYHDEDKHSQKLNRSLSNIQQALAVSPNDAECLNLLSRIELEYGHFSLAEQAIKKALSINPNNGGYWYSYGHIALATHQLDNAEQAFNKAMDLAPKETRAEVGLAYTYSEQGKQVEAFQLYRQLIKTEHRNIQVKSRLIQSTKGLVADYYDPELEQELITYLSWDDLNLDCLSHLCCSTLIYKFQLTQQGSALSFNDMASCTLLQKTLKKTLIKNELLEKLIIALRQELLTHASKKGRLINQYIPICEAICQYQIRNEFLLPYTEAERSMILAIKNVIDKSLSQTGCMPIDISGALMLFSMYESWYTLDRQNELFAFANDNWPEISFSIKCAHDKLLYKEKNDFRSLTPLDHSSKNSVKTQYERFPYPRWSTLGNHTKINYGRALQHEFPWVNIPETLQNKPLNILIAGCGTGRQALNVAKYFHHTHVTAIDISQKSLNYAYKKSEEFKIDNVDFYLADLTRLPILDNAFDIIECSGVLHHIRQHHCALQNLLSNLRPSGFIKLSLYSKRARQPVYDIRKRYKHGGIEKNEQDIRVLRHVIFSDNEIKNKHLITESDDFYSMSGVVDLLLHEFEIGFTPASIKRLCAHHQLRFLGFSNLETQIKQQFKEFVGKEYNFSDLNQWEAFEEAFPETFSAMYQFYCQYQPRLSLNLT